MKRNVIALMLLLLSSTSWAQGWKLVVTRNNGTTIEAMTRKYATSSRPMSSA